jgi:hypothetical protein
MLKKILQKITYSLVFLIFAIAGITAWSEIESGSLSYSPKPQQTVTPEDSWQVQADTNGIIENTQSPGDKIVLDFVIDRNGYVVVYGMTNGTTGSIIGISDLLTPGTYRSTEVKLNRPTQPGEKLLVKLHAEQDNNTTFDMKRDTPIQRVTGSDVTATIVVTN